MILYILIIILAILIFLIHIYNISKDSPISVSNITKQINFNSTTPIQRAEYAMQTIDNILKYKPTFFEKFFSFKGIPKWREFAGRKQTPASAWPLGQFFAAALDMAMFTKNYTVVNSVVKELDNYKYESTYRAIYMGVIAPSPVYTNKYYDDNLWIGLDFLQAYGQTKNVDFINRSKNMVPFFETGMFKDGVGMIWYEGAQVHTFNVCTQGPAIIFFLGLYYFTKDKYYMDLALRIEPVLNGLLRLPNGLYIDNVNILDYSDRNTVFLTYNQGVAIGANLQFYIVSTDENIKQRYLDLLNTTINALLKMLLADDNVLWKSPPCYNAILYRYLAKFDALFPDPRIEKIFSSYLKRLWDTARNPLDGAFELRGVGAHRDAETTGMTLIDQSGVVQMFAVSAMNKEQRLMIF